MATKKRSPNYKSSEERLVRSENPRDARVQGKIKDINARVDAGLMSEGEKQRALNRMTKSDKEMRRKTAEAKARSAKTRPVASGGVPAKRKANMKASGAMGGGGSMDIYATPQERIKRKLK